jgi:hypothetical protein
MDLGERQRHLLMHAHERFHRAVHGLAVGSAPLNERIADVFATDLSDLAPTDLPHEVGARLKAYQREWRALGDVGPEGRIRVWARSLSLEKAREVAHWIVDADDEIDGLLNDELYRSR